MKKRLFSVFMVVILLLLSLCSLAVSAKEEVGNRSDITVTVPINTYTLHSMVDNQGYYPSASNQVKVLDSGHKSLGQLSIHGNVEKKMLNGKEAYAVNGGSIKFTYRQSWTDSSANGHSWKLSSDGANAIAGHTIGTIGNGGILILKSHDGKTWSKVTSTVGIQNKTVEFVPDGKDIGRGTTYKFIHAVEGYYSYTYQSGTKTKYPSYGDAPLALQLLGGPAAVGVWILANGWEEPVYDTANYYQNFAQVFEIYVASDTCQVGFYSDATDQYDASKTIEDVSTETLEILKKGTTLSHNSVSLNKIRVDKLGNTSFDVVCSYNEGDAFTVADGAVFTQPGRYHFTITSKFLTQRELDIYILDPGDDYAYTKYFGGNFVSQNKRVFDKTSQIPVYMVGTNLNVTPETNVPGLYGTIYRYEDASAVEENVYEIVHTFTDQSEAKTIPLTKIGIYCADFYAGNPNACGEIIHYGFYFSVVDNENYKPTVNLEMLLSADRHVMLKTSNYAVNFATAGGGSYVFVFPATEDGYEDALAFSETIEYRFIEEYVDTNGAKYYYYKAHGTSGLKERYDSKVELYTALGSYAKENVNLTYTNNTEAYATMTLDEAIANIENTSIKNDIKVCIGSQVRDALVAEDIILNGYMFYQPATYESSSVTATAEDGTVYTIPYDVAVETILPGTGKYLITESNWNGDSTYYVTYFAPGEITGSISYVAYKDYKDFSGSIDSSTNAIIEANTITLVAAKDKYDSQSIVSIVRLGERKNMLLSEVDHYTISEPGTYMITMVNRCGFSTSATVKLTESPKIKMIFAENEQWNRTVTYGEALGNLPEAERIGYVFLGWLNDGVPVTADTVCKWEDEVVLTPWFEEKSVDIILNYFNGFTRLKGTYGTSIALEDAANIEDLFAFAYWEYEGSAVQELKIETLETVILTAKYYRMDDNMEPLTEATYNAFEITPLMSAKRIVEEPDRILASDFVPSSIEKAEEKGEIALALADISQENMPVADHDTSTSYLMFASIGGGVIALLGIVALILRKKKN